MRLRANAEDPEAHARSRDAGATPAPMLIVLLVLAFGPSLLAATATVRASDRTSPPLSVRPSATLRRISPVRTPGR